jgi:hypothetical protein
LQQGVLCSHASDTTCTTATWSTLAFDTEEWKVGLATRIFTRHPAITRV